MILSARIDHDYKCLNNYFRKLFDVMQEAIEEDQVTPLEGQDSDATESQAIHHSFAHFIKPDMLMNIYSLVDFWMKEICKYQKNKKNLNLSYKDIKGNNDLDAYQKYLTLYAGLDLNTVQASYKQLDNLRKIRNYLIHGGGHIPNDKALEKELETIKGIKIFGSLIIIEDNFVWNTLEHAKKYLNAATQT